MKYQPQAILGIAFLGCVLVATGTQAADPAPKPATAPAAAAKPAAPGAAKPATPAPQMYYFKDLGKIVTWRPTGDHELYVKTEANEWYRVHIYEPCVKLFPGKTPVFLTETDDRNVRSNAARFDRSKCIVTDITKGDPPPRAPQ